MLDKATEMDKEVHPYAEAFVLMTDEDLQALADDIKENGLLNPIIVDQDDRLIDGRNREAACKLAGVKPKYLVREFANDDEVASFILSQNQHRRHITKGQLAMGVAFIYPDPGKRGRGNKSKVSLDFSSMRLSQARKVLSNSKDLAGAVRSGTVSLDAALKKVEEELVKSQSAERRLAELRENAADLADLVVEERMELSEAYTTYQRRLQKQLDTFRTGVTAANRLDSFVTDVNSIVGSFDLIARGIIADDKDLLHNLNEKTIQSLEKSLTLLRKKYEEHTRR